EQIDVDDPLPVALVNLAQRPADGDAGVVADHVHLAEGRYRLQRRAADAIAITHIADHALGPHLARIELAHCAAERLLLDVGNHHLHAFAPKRFGHGEAEPRRAAGDEGDLVTQIFHVCSSVPRLARTNTVETFFDLCDARVEQMFKLGVCEDVEGVVL